MAKVTSRRIVRDTRVFKEGVRIPQSHPPVQFELKSDALEKGLAGSQAALGRTSAQSVA
jgi:hypothetical protein